MDDLLTPVSTTYRRPRREEGSRFADIGRLPASVVEASGADCPSQLTRLTSADDVIDALKAQPAYDDLVRILRFLTTPAGVSHSTPLQACDAKSASIVHLLVTEIIPSYWPLLSEGSSPLEPTDPASSSRGARHLTQCLQSLTGLNAVLTQTKALIQEQRVRRIGSKHPDIAPLDIFLEVLSSLLQGDGALREIWLASTCTLKGAALKKTQSHQLVSLVAGGRILSLAAEAQTLTLNQTVPGRAQWIGDGAEFSSWLARSAISWAKSTSENSELQVCEDFIQRGMSLGYSETITKVLIDNLLLVTDPQPSIFVALCMRQASTAKRFVQNLLEYLSRRYLGTIGQPCIVSKISAVASVIDSVIGNESTRRDQLVSWCASSSGAGLGDGIGIRRAVVAVLAKDKETITSVLEKLLSQFGDVVYIKHAAILQQQVHTEVLLLCAAYVQKLAPIKLAMILRSSTYLTVISNRIAATQVKARLLGMIVGEALSSLNGGSVKPLHFQMEETETEEAQNLKQLATVSDRIGPIEPLLCSSSSPPSQPAAPVSSSPVASKMGKVRPSQQTTEPAPRAMIEELDSSDDGEDDDLKPYAKHSDPEDSDDDPTLIQRNKPKPPVYVRDLISYLRDSDDYDRQKLALRTAPLLIRRKANFGGEVSSHAVELARLLVGLQDKFEIEDFHELRQQGMVALVVAQPKTMGPWLSRTFFEGDYSLAQRVSVLVTLGLSARELSGFETSRYQEAASFPSKQLPKKMAQLFVQPGSQGVESPPSPLKALPSSALNTITRSLTSAFLEPVAAEAADAVTGPDVLKMQTFTARAKSRSNTKPRIRSIPNTTAALLASSFFHPLTAHFQFALRSSKPVVLNPELLSLYLQTLGIIVHASGPSTLSLPQLTSELWDLLLAVRTHALGDLGATRGWLVAMAASLEVNEADMRRLCEAQPKELVEMRLWVGGVFERTRGEDGGEENQVKMLAAGVLIRLGEAIEKYQAMLMGDMIGY